MDALLAYVQAPETLGACEFAQVPPSINQPSRPNCAFLVHDERWRPDRIIPVLLLAGHDGVGESCAGGARLRRPRRPGIPPPTELLSAKSALTRPNGAPRNGRHPQVAAHGTASQPPPQTGQLDNVITQLSSTPATSGPS
jgi:hypothetical protein